MLRLHLLLDGRHGVLGRRSFAGDEVGSLHSALPHRPPFVGGDDGVREERPPVGGHCRAREIAGRSNGSTGDAPRIQPIQLNAMLTCMSVHAPVRFDMPVFAAHRSPTGA